MAASVAAQGALLDRAAVQFDDLEQWQGGVFAFESLLEHPVHQFAGGGRRLAAHAPRFAEYGHAFLDPGRMLGAVIISPARQADVDADLLGLVHLLVAASGAHLGGLHG